MEGREIRESRVMSKMSELTLILGGDTGVTKRFSEEIKAEPKYASFLNVLEEGDIVFANLECALTNYEYPETPDFSTANKCDPIVAKDLASIGIDIFSLAHRVLDFGNRGLFDSIDALDKENIKHVGGGRTPEEATKEEIIEVRDQRVGFLSFDAAYSKKTEAKAVPSADRKTYLNKPGLAPIHVKTVYEIEPSTLALVGLIRAIIERSYVEEKSLGNVVEKIKNVKKNVNLLVVAVHWGTLADELLEYQRPLGHALIDAGADVIAGSHPHRTHGVEIYKGKPIFYSLGNFIYHRTGLHPNLGSEQTIGRVKIVGENITKVELIPTLTDNLGTSIANLKSRDDRLEYLKQFEEKHQLDTKYSIHGKEIPIEIEM